MKNIILDERLKSIVNDREHIEIDLSIRFGRPIIKGARISVYEVFNWLANEMSSADILEVYLELKKVLIQSCLYSSGPFTLEEGGIEKDFGLGLIRQ